MRVPNFYSLFRGVAPWAPAAGRLITATFLTLVGLGIVFMVLRRPKLSRPATWAQCMAGAVFTFAMFLLCYGVVPHEWMTFANSYLNMSTDKIFLSIKSSREIPGTSIRWPLTIPMSAVRDAVAAVIYVIFFALNLLLWSMWQKRPIATDEDHEPETRVVGTSRFGRPLKAKV